MAKNKVNDMLEKIRQERKQTLQEQSKLYLLFYYFIYAYIITDVHTGNASQNVHINQETVDMDRGGRRAEQVRIENLKTQIHSKYYQPTNHSWLVGKAIRISTDTFFGHAGLETELSRYGTVDNEDSIADAVLSNIPSGVLSNVVILKNVATYMAKISEMLDLFEQKLRVKTEVETLGLKGDRPTRKAQKYMNALLALKYLVADTTFSDFLSDYEVDVVKQSPLKDELKGLGFDVPNIEIFTD